MALVGCAYKKAYKLMVQIETPLANEHEIGIHA